VGAMGRTSLPALEARLGRGLSTTIVTWNVVEYRKAAERHVAAGDCVLEVGCCGGTTTSIIGVEKSGRCARPGECRARLLRLLTEAAPAGRHCGYVVGIDQTAAEIAIANKRFRVPGKVEFEVGPERMLYARGAPATWCALKLTSVCEQVMDAFDMAAVLRLQSKIGRQFNKVFIDINGSRDIGTVCDCMDKYQKVTLKFSTPWPCRMECGMPCYRSLEPRFPRTLHQVLRPELIVLKSIKLRTLLHQVLPPARPLSLSGVLS